MKKLGQNNNTPVTYKSVVQDAYKVKKEDWPVVSARIPPELRKELMKRYKKRGELSNIIYYLLQHHVMQPAR